MDATLMSKIPSLEPSRDIIYIVAVYIAFVIVQHNSRINYTAFNFCNISEQVIRSLSNFVSEIVRQAIADKGSGFFVRLRTAFDCNALRVDKGDEAAAFFLIILKRTMIKGFFKSSIICMIR